MDNFPTVAINGQRSKVLVVDDSVENIEIIEYILADLEYDIYKALNGQEALEKIDKVEPDIILLDVVMPGMSGFEVAKHVKNNKNTRLFIASPCLFN